MQREAVRKLTISLPFDLVQFAEVRARQLATSRSAYIASLIAERQRQEQDELAREGYEFFAAESEEHAARSMRIAHEVLDDDRS